MKKPEVLLPKMGELLTSRPKGMDIDTYHEQLKWQNKRLRKRKNGFLVWASNGFVKRKDNGEVETTDIKEKGKPIIKIPVYLINPMGTFEGLTKNLKAL
jgi:hypothetical protein